MYYVFAFCPHRRIITSECLANFNDSSGANATCKRNVDAISEVFKFDFCNFVVILVGILQNLAHYIRQKYLLTEKGLALYKELGE